MTTDWATLGGQSESIHIIGLAANPDSSTHSLEGLVACRELGEAGIDVRASTVDGDVIPFILILIIW